MVKVQIFELIYFFVYFSICLSEDAPQVTIKQGTLRGAYRKTWKGKSFKAFTGIPYAKPPVGDLRFKVPVPAESWVGILDASKPHAICPQTDAFFQIYEPSGSEDCLYLNVFTPQLKANRTGPLPVMVFIHGGGFLSGSANPRLNGPDMLLDKDVILVTINYRLGALGFLSMGDEVLPGNNGLKDQSLALRWVKDNIANFGGDPKRITIFGQSAGGSSVHFHVLSPLSKDLIFAAISHSGTSIATWAFAPKSQAIGNAKRLATYLNCPSNSTQDMVDCLRKVDAYDFLRQDEKFVDWNLDPGIPFKPVVEPNIEGAFLTDLPTEVIKSGNFAQVPFMAGVLTEDGALESATIYNKTEQIEEFNKDYFKLAPLVFQYHESVPNQLQISKKIREFYLGNKTIDNSTRAEVTDMFTDSWFLAPQNHISILQASYSKQPVYYYLFGYRGSVSFGPFYGDPSYNYGVTHNDELLYLLSCEVFNNYTPSKTDEEMIEIMTTLWTNFAKTGNPTPHLDETINNKWEPLKGKDLKFYYIESANNVSMIENPYLNRTIFWQQNPIFAGTQ